jgi:hypothetical protein
MCGNNASLKNWWSPIINNFFFSWYITSSTCILSGLHTNPSVTDVKKGMRRKTYLLSWFRMSVNCYTWLEQLPVQENKFHAWAVYRGIMLKPRRAKFHALFGLSTYTRHQNGSSKRLAIYWIFSRLPSY